MRSVSYALGFPLIFLLLLQVQPVFCQQTDLDYFIRNALKNDVTVRSNVNRQQFYGLQARLIDAQNKAPQVTFTSDYILAPFFGSNGKPVSITTNPSANAFGYDVGQTNGGTYATQLNVALPLLNKRVISSLQEENNNAAAINGNNRLQLEHDLRKSITDQYIQVYQYSSRRNILP